MATVPDKSGNVSVVDRPLSDRCIYTAVFTAVGVAADQDLFAILPPADTHVCIREVRIGQHSDFGDTASELLNIQIIRGYTTAGSGGNLVIPKPVKPWIPPALSTVRINDDTPASAGTPSILISDDWNIMAGWWYYPPEKERVWSGFGDRIVVRLMDNPIDSLTTDGTITFEELST